MFQFQIDGEFFESVVIPFGWSLAPFVFTKFTRPVITAMRYPLVAQEHNYRGLLPRLRTVAGKYFVQIYLDDILILTTLKEHMHEMITAFFGVTKKYRDPLSSLQVHFGTTRAYRLPRHALGHTKSSLQTYDQIIQKTSRKDTNIARPSQEPTTQGEPSVFG